MPDENTQFTKSDSQMLKELHRAVVGCLTADGKHQRGMADMVEDHEKILRGSDGETGLVADMKELKTDKAKMLGAAAVVAAIITVIGAGIGWAIEAMRGK